MPAITEEELRKIVELANKVPEEYRQKCFELLLAQELQIKNPAVPAVVTPAQQLISPAIPKSFVIPIDVKAFLSQYGLDESLLGKFFLIDGEEIRPIYKLKVTAKSKAQIQHALMMAFENACKSGQFQVEIESLRARCVEQKCYDSANFSANIKNNAKLFKFISTDQPLSLSPDGKSDLAELLEELEG
jgi:hypothetical protein